MKKTIVRILECLLLAALFICFVFPFYWMLLTSFKGTLEAMLRPPTWWPVEWVWTNYREAWDDAGLGRYYLNSVILSVGCTASTMLCSVPAAYAFAKKKFKLSGLLFGILLLDLMIPPQAYFVGVFLMFSKAKILNTYGSMILLYAYSGTTIFFLRNAFKQVQEEVLEAARLDGASEFTTLFRVLMPMIKPMTIAVTMLTFISRWNSYFWYKVLTTTEKIHTLPLAIQKLMIWDSENLPRWDLTMAGNVLMMAPLLILYIFAAQKIKEAFIGNGIK